MSDWISCLERWVRLACIAEVNAAKPGNVSPQHQFCDVSIDDFLRSADAIAPILAQVNQLGIGKTILSAVEATQAVVQANTNLGIVLLLAPLAAVPQEQSLREGIESVLLRLTQQDAADTYAAIRIAGAGGLGTATAEDVADIPTQDLRSCMRLAADRDLIAAQYANGFDDVLHTGVSLLVRTRSWESCGDSRLGWVALNLMSQFGDSLILRKCGRDLDAEIRRRAASVLDAGWPLAEHGQPAYSNFDQFLRADGNNRNPGTTADMIAAILFAAFREGFCVPNDTGIGLEFVPA